MPSAADTSRNLFEKLGFTHNITKTSSGSQVHTYTSDLGPDTPILTLIHGYPQSAYEWRYVAPALKDKVSLFIPELPGYGISTPIKSDTPIPSNSKRSVGNALLEALAATFNTAQTPRKVIIGGHDRGARISHRLAVDFSHPPSANAAGAHPTHPDIFPHLNLTVIGNVLLDIIPTTVQWARFSDPVISSGYFHWPMLANPELSTQLISAFGGANWARGANTRIAGPNPESIRRISADGAVDIYAENFSTDEVLYYTALDYASGSAPESTEQDEDQKAARKVEVPLLVMFSKAKLGARTDVEAVWKDWVGSGVDYRGVGVGDGYGHYLPEEAHETVVEEVVAFLKKVT
ncbi:hypothetical protein PV10_02909 [Exophiala mesophila]|uniref:AB hydrolase-1 domain-containing protein n=1 Tax=Exophiala mesophila TaxID=212818 RepID=A0A0D1ZKR1_EXOME|nr:uncharacterized protein PV10_02909 [Exophiala mesophila]KIV95232.1 hypothetical protein PV10_02909 [Exophiala mesophila]